MITDVSVKRFELCTDHIMVIIVINSEQYYICQQGRNLILFFIQLHFLYSGSPRSWCHLTVNLIICMLACVKKTFFFTVLTLDASDNPISRRSLTETLEIESFERDILHIQTLLKRDCTEMASSQWKIVKISFVGMFRSPTTHNW